MKQAQVTKAFGETFGGEHHFFAAPGRINLIGEHTDYNDGFVMPAAIDKRIYLAMAPTEDNTAEIYSVDFDETVTFDINEKPDRMPHWALYPLGVVKELQAAGATLKGFKSVFGGDIPKGAGLSSSAALESVFATALNHIFHLVFDKLTLAKTGQLAEHNYAGVKCGIMDQFASIHGKAGYVMQLDCRSLDYSYFPLNLQDCELLLADTRVKHSLASSAYNQRREECEQGARILSTKIHGVKNLRDVSPVDVRKYKELLSEKVFLRCEYVTEENDRVAATAKALAGGELEEAGRMLYSSHYGLKDKYEVSCPELDLLVETARNTPGVLGARMMGGGFGGCTLNLLKSSSVDLLTERMTESFRKKFGSEPLFYRVNTSEGAMKI